MRYRADVDGLRAVAIVSVVVFHLSSRLKGGFVGVDVFFVISGYLITGLIQAEMQRGAFSLSGFYERRIRRILPALIAMLAVTTAACGLIIFAAPFEDYAKSLIAALGSVSNVYFWLQTDYFTRAGQTAPLLHTWSLAVEEQFYLLFPPLLMLIHRVRPKALVLTVAVLAVVSLGANIATIAVFKAQHAAFYLPHARAWELMLGALVALRAHPPVRAVWARNVIGAVGLALIAVSLAVIDNSNRLFGMALLAPCLGAAMVIASGEGEAPTWTSKLLAWRPFVFIGLISYSLYLWHWPIIVLFKAYTGVEVDLPAQIKAVALALSLVAAILSWALVERPFRRRRGGRARVFAIAAAAVAAVGAAGAAIVFLQGAPQRFAPDIARVTAPLGYKEFADFRTGICFLDSTQPFTRFHSDDCLKSFPGKSNVLLMGDSFAAQLYYGLAHTLPADINLMQANSSGCRATIAASSVRDGTKCRQLTDLLFSQFLPSHKVDLLILSGRWRTSDFEQLKATLKWAAARGQKVLLVGPTPEYDAPMPQLLGLGRLRGDRSLVGRHRLDDTAKIDRGLAEIASQAGVAYSSPYQFLCPTEVCLEVLPGDVPVQFDNAHLTPEGSIVVAKSLLPQIAAGVRGEAAR